MDTSVGVDFLLLPLLMEETAEIVEDSGSLGAPTFFSDLSDVVEFWRSSIGVTGVENAGGGLMMGNVSDMGDSIVTSGGGVGARIGDSSLIGIPSYSLRFRLEEGFSC